MMTIILVLVGLATLVACGLGAVVVAVAVLIWRIERAARDAVYDVEEDAEQGIEDLEYFLEEVARNDGHGI
jgi:hypothetical protein